MAARWSDLERQNIRDNVKNGMPVEDLKKILRSRTESAIIRELQKYNYGVKTTGGVARFYFNKKSRNRKRKTDDKTKGAKEIVTVGERRTVQAAQIPTITSETIHTESDQIIAYNNPSVNSEGLNAYKQAMNVLINMNCVPEHKMVCELSSFILQQQKGGAK